MSESIEAIINPELLIWARKSAGLSISDAAKKAQVSEDKLSDWELGKSMLSISQLRKLGKIYKRPIAVFYLPEPPVTFDAIRDYRIIYGSDHIGELSPSLRLEIRKAQYRREVALEMSELLGEDIKPFEERISPDNDVDKNAEYIRNLLGISIEDQSKWNDSYKAFNAWKDAIESLDIMIFQTASASKIELKEMRGISINESIFPIIILNSKDQPNGKIFTLIHEFVHILLNNGGICNWTEYSDSGDLNVETICNQIVASVLVPKNDILKHEVVVNNENPIGWADSELKSLASFFSVSQEVILRRLLDLKKTTLDFYKKKRNDYLELYEKMNLNKKTGHPEYYRLIIRNNGLSYTRRVLDAYYQSRITSSEVSDYLGMNLKHLSKIGQAVMNFQEG